MTTTSLTTPETDRPGLARRPVLCGAAALCAAAIGGCTGYGKGRPPAPAQQAPANNGAAPAGGAAAGTAIAKVADIPVGGGRVLTDQQLVVTRLNANDVKVLSAVCTHQGCLVDSVTNGTIGCPCHGSAFSLTGEVTSGPATKPLPPKQFKVIDGVVTI